MAETLAINSELTVSWLGPPLSAGPLPTLFYFALSAYESLEMDPYNQPALYLADYPLRIFSLDLPAHGAGLNPVHALTVWAEQMSQGNDPISECVQKASVALDALIERGAVEPGKIGVMGLSRGGFIGAHLSARRDDIAALLGFAPLTHLSFAKEFSEVKTLPAVEKLDLPHLIPSLSSQRLRFYIGNRDTRVSTRLCYELVESLVDAAFEKGQRSPPIELILSPSIGHMGHGTAKEIFHDGAHWIGQTLGVIS
jgi:esterase FrsA